jgi:DNA-binding transcriptional regulator/RsmH inhibitor MraZ
MNSQRLQSNYGKHLSLQKSARDYMRVMFAGAHDEIPDRQGRVTIFHKVFALMPASKSMRCNRRKHSR